MQTDPSLDTSDERTFELITKWVSFLPFCLALQVTPGHNVTWYLLFSLAHRHPDLQFPNYQLPPSTALTIPNPLLTCLPVSSDTAIAIAFGVLGTAINLLGILLAYLTLRAMTIENGTYRTSLHPTLSTSRPGLTIL